mmetsp:Transcript_33116/g.92774  ORF Transcript_33116/g.92774 Transcript_33116/m.92774 type:complete len:247 (-) Transcript_33116:3883-4623(-)
MGLSLGVPQEYGEFRLEPLNVGDDEGSRVDMALRRLLQASVLLLLLCKGLQPVEANVGAVQPPGGNAVHNIRVHLGIVLPRRETLHVLQNLSQPVAKQVLELSPELLVHRRVRLAELHNCHQTALQEPRATHARVPHQFGQRHRALQLHSDEVLVYPPAHLEEQVKRGSRLSPRLCGAEITLPHELKREVPAVRGVLLKNGIRKVQHVEVQQGVHMSQKLLTLVFLQQEQNEVAHHPRHDDVARLV